MKSILQFGTMNNTSTPSTLISESVWSDFVTIHDVYTQQLEVDWQEVADTTERIYIEWMAATNLTNLTPIKKETSTQNYTL